MEEREKNESDIKIKQATSLEKEVQTSENKENPTIHGDEIAEENQRVGLGKFLFSLKNTIKEMMEDQNEIVVEDDIEKIEEIDKKEMQAEINKEEPAELLTFEEYELAEKEARIKRKEEQRIAPLTFFQCLAFVMICITPVIDLLFLLFWALPWKYGNLSRKRMARAVLFVKVLVVAVFGTMVYRETERLLEYYEPFFYEYNEPNYNMPEYYSPKQKEFLFPVEST